MEFRGEARELEDGDLERAASALDCDVAAVRAVAKLESRGGGFLDDGRPKILFEAHAFSSRTEHAYDDSHPEISSLKWNRKLYGPGGAHQYKRLNIALALSKNAALASASWGMFQVMGFNFEYCGYRSMKSFIDAMVRSEGDHLDAMVAFIKKRNLDEALRSHDWASFAYGYNGKGYAENRYDEKLEAAWLEFSEGIETLHLREVQARLNRAGASPRLTEDGLIGPKTRRAIRAFQRERGIEPTGHVGPITNRALLEL